MRLATLHWKEGDQAYTGVELRPHFLLERFGLKGSALAAFVGPCEVRTEHLVDWEDRLARDHIRAARMVHFIGEFFGITLREGVLMQRLLMASMGETLGISGLHRDGDDLFFRASVAGHEGTDERGNVDGGRNADGHGNIDTDGRKLSVSIVTASPVSILLHAGVNIDPTGAPVPAIGLRELGVEPEAWISRLLERFRGELESIEWACAKVRPVM